MGDVHDETWYNSAEGSGHKALQRKCIDGAAEACRNLQIISVRQKSHVTVGLHAVFGCSDRFGASRNEFARVLPTADMLIRAWERM